MEVKRVSNNFEKSLYQYLTQELSSSLQNIKSKGSKIKFKKIINS